MAYKDPEKARERSRKWYTENRERHLENGRARAAANPERYTAYKMIANARRNAAEKGVPFDLDDRTDDLHEIILAGTCHYTGLPFSVGGGLTWDSPSLDRVVPELGYVWDNVRVVLSCINSFKGTTTLGKMCFIAEHLLDWQAAKMKRSVLLSDQQTPTAGDET